MRNCCNEEGRVRTEKLSREGFRPSTLERAPTGYQFPLTASYHPHYYFKCSHLAFTICFCAAISIPIEWFIVCGMLKLLEPNQTSCSLPGVARLSTALVAFLSPWTGSQKGEDTTLSNSQNNSLTNLLLSRVLLVNFSLTIMWDRQKIDSTHCQLSSAFELGVIHAKVFGEPLANFIK